MKKCASTLFFPFMQCGGVPSPVLYKHEVIRNDTYEGAKCCTDESICVYKTQYYSQCIPKEQSTADNANVPPFCPPTTPIPANFRPAEPLHWLSPIGRLSPCIS